MKADCLNCEFRNASLSSNPCCDCKNYDHWTPQPSNDDHIEWCRKCNNIGNCHECEWNEERPSNFEPKKTGCEFCAHHIAGDLHYSLEVRYGSNAGCIMSIQYCPLCGRRLRLERKEEKS